MVPRRRQLLGGGGRCSGMNRPSSRKAVAASSSQVVPAFDDVLKLIDAARRRAFAAVNTELVRLYWRVGAHLSRKLETAEWGDAVVDDLSAAIARRHPGLRGFTRRNLFRMRQFYETYRREKKVSALLTQLPWTHHLIVMGQAKSAAEREFYLRVAIKERWGSRELERQLRVDLFARATAKAPKVSAALTRLHPMAPDAFKDAYFVEFLNLPDGHSESDLHRALLTNLQRFILEMGRDFSFVGSEYPLQVGGRDFALDLLFFHRGLNALVAIELKAGRFEPEHLGKLQFYLEALDRDVKKAHERPSIGLLLCATKEDEVVEYALARATSPALIAEYQTMLPTKTALRTKLHEIYRALTTEAAKARSPRTSTLKHR
jgi:predicted nuclease of restriction endonuclease-like (RecB) superfamily